MRANIKITVTHISTISLTFSMAEQILQSKGYAVVKNYLCLTSKVKSLQHLKDLSNSAARVSAEKKEYGPSAMVAS